MEIKNEPYWCMEKNSIEKINSSKPWLDKSANNDDDDVTHWQKKTTKNHIWVLKKSYNLMWDTLMKLTLTVKCACYKWCNFNWVRGGDRRFGAHGGANTNESVCGCCLGTIRESAPPDLMNLCWDVSSSVCVEWVPARCHIRTNGKKSRWQMSAS